LSDASTCAGVTSSELEASEASALVKAICERG